MNVIVVVGTKKSIRSDVLSQIKIGGCLNLPSNIEKTCVFCGKNFFPKKQAKTRKYCYNCMPEQVYNNGASIRKQIKKLALQYKGGRCERCGYNKCSEALDFHHTDTNQKDFNISDHNLTSD